MSPHAYIPDALPLGNLDYRMLLPLVGQANAALARYDGLLQSIPNPAVMLSPLTTQEATHSQYTVHILDAIFSKPVFRSSDLAEKLNREYGIHEKTTPGLLRQIRAAGILRELQSGSGRRPATLCFPRLINLAEGREVI